MYAEFYSKELVEEDRRGGVSAVGLKCRTPSGLLLFDGLTLVVPPGGRLLIMVRPTVGARWGLSDVGRVCWQAGWWWLFTLPRVLAVLRLTPDQLGRRVGPLGRWQELPAASAGRPVAFPGGPSATT